MRVAARAVETPKSRSMSRRVSRVRSSFSSCLMASGMARSHRQSSPADEQAAARQRERPGAIHLGEHSESPPDAHAGPDGRVYVRLDGRTGDRGDAHRLQAHNGRRGPGLYRQTPASWLRYPKGSMSQTSAATPANPPMKATSSVAKRRSPPAATCAAAGAWRAKKRRSARMETRAAGVRFHPERLGGTPAGRQPFLVNLLRLYELGRFPARMSLDMLVEGFPECKIRVPSFEGPIKGVMG